MIDLISNLKSKAIEHKKQNALAGVMDFCKPTTFGLKMVNIVSFKDIIKDYIEAEKEISI